ncbi:MAG: hypothetical protein O2955_09910 [Planctomycetota bacterium]|nr:hypothetical protein [Planctomycetota bacterium]MDA1212825.1 hypothetical protein [Planctomycetota bacterium]
MIESQLAATKDPLVTTIVDRIDALLLQAETETRPLEIEPFRSRLFELFVLSDGAGYLQEHADVDLTADSLCRLLSQRWGLAEATQQATESQTRIPQEQLSKMRLLWSLMRMWMEWTYAWKRWHEFHGENSNLVS